ncbi:TrmH family RNA methyltransferase [Dasania marina]|uniref:TrmH family RNA methyltransferase n=1 Tax=Dasania marina TaxID=471499 RepID=UPI00037366CC|nr:RNA methyltransferase [Dasania marina]
MTQASDQPQDSEQYKKKQQFFKSLLTIYGRKPILEALQNPQLEFFKLHLADSNKPQGIIAEILQLAEQREIEVQYHDKKALSRISKNAKQDQGIAADIKLKQYLSVEQFLASNNKDATLIALDRITNPQNLGMIIRSVCAGYVDGLILPQKGCAALSPLVIKASTGTVFKTPLLYSESIEQALQLLSDNGATICTLSSHAKTSLFDYQAKGVTVYVLGNETDGVSQQVAQLSDHQLTIPMSNDVESLNVAITAALIAFKK